MAGLTGGIPAVRQLWRTFLKKREPTEERAAEVAGRARWSDPKRRLRALSWVTAVLVVVCVPLLMLYMAERGSAVARTEAVEAARRLTPQLLTFEYRTIGPDSVRAKSAATGDFAREVAEFVDGRVTPDAIKDAVVTTATVRDSAVVGGDAERVVVMLLIDQVSTSKVLPAPRIDNVSVRVTMSRFDGNWRLANVERL
jgi:Mce-associated membrane protein